MKVVWVTTSVPDPAGGGGRSHEYELIRALAHDHDIHVVTCDFRNREGGAAVGAASARFSAVEWTVRPYPTSKLGVARGLLRADPTLTIWLGRDRIPKLVDAIAGIVAVERPDLVQVTHGELAHLLDHLHPPTALLLFDALTRALDTRRTVEPLARRRLQLRVEHARARRFERTHYAKATGIASVSSVDAAAVEALVHRPVTVLENPVSESFFEPPDRPRSTTIVSFVGALAHQPNSDAIRRLVVDIWPLVIARRPDAELRVAGRADGDPTVPELRRLVEGVGGRLDADVPDIRPYYWEAAVTVAPLRHGSGLRNKVIHAMACGAPVVASPAALEGIPPEIAEHVWSGSTDDELAAAVVAVLDDSTAASARAAAAIESVAVLRTEHAAARHAAWWEQLRGQA